jgi:DsbC/DsbD-like thiol-disulfide interchange protein
MVIERKFDRSHRVRPSGSVLVADLTGEELPAAVSGVAAGPGVAARVWLDEATFFPAQRLYAHIRVQIEEGLHVYVPPLEEGYVPLQVRMDAQAGLVAEAFKLPDGTPFRVEGLDEEFSVVEGTVDVKVPFYISDEATGDVTLTVRIGYQACTESVCLAPEELRIDLPLEYQPIPRPS